MRHPRLAPGWIDRPHERLGLGSLRLESGETVQDAFVSYVVHGSAARLQQDAAAILSSRRRSAAPTTGSTS